MKFLIRWLGISLCFHLLAGWLSVGFYDMDEHFQILEFLNYRLGRSGAENLAWEFHAHMRSWLQPFLYEGIVRVAIRFGIHDPFKWAMMLRLFSALLGWGSLVGLALCCYRWFQDQKWREIAIRVLCIFWCLPYLHARTSGENLSGTFFWLAVALYVLNSGQRFLFLFGFLLGLSFDLRYQMAIPVATVLIWALLIEQKEQKSLKFLFKPLLGCISAVIFGLALDRWGYQSWGFTPWNYFYQNVVLGKAAQFGVSPAWYYFEDLVRMMPPVGVGLLVCVICAWVKRPLHILSVITFTFVVAHSLFAHKEQRFLYPMLPVLPVLCVLGLQAVQAQLKALPQSWIYVGARALVLFDVGALLVATLKPSSNQPNFYQAVFAQEPPIEELYYVRHNPYSVGGSDVYFYRRPGLQLHALPSVANLDSMKNHKEFWLFYDQFNLPPETVHAGGQCDLQYTVYPRWLDYFSFLVGPRKFASRWSLWVCH